MVKQEKLMDKARNHPGGLSFADLETLLEQNAWVFKRQTGSHRFWKTPSGEVVPIQPNGGKAKEYQVKQVLKIMENENV